MLSFKALFPSWGIGNDDDDDVETEEGLYCWDRSTSMILKSKTRILTEKVVLNIFVVHLSIGRQHTSNGIKSCNLISKYIYIF